MKKLIILSIALFFVSFAWSQKVSEGKVDFLKDKADGLTITIEGQVKNVEEVLDRKFKSLKSKNEKGFKAYLGQIFPEISSDMLDYYYKVEKEKENNSTIIFVLSKGYDNFLTSATNNSEINNAKKMLENLVAEVRRYELELAIEAQVKVFEKATKENEKLVSEGESLVKEQKKLEDALVKNKSDQESNKKSQEDQKIVVGLEKKTLDELQKSLSQVK